MAYTEPPWAPTLTSVSQTVSASLSVQQTSLIEWIFQVNRRRWTKEHQMTVAKPYSQSGRLIRLVNRTAFSVVRARSSAPCKRSKSLNLRTTNHRFFNFYDLDPGTITPA